MHWCSLAKGYSCLMYTDISKMCCMIKWFEPFGFSLKNINIYFWNINYIRIPPILFKSMCKHMHDLVSLGIGLYIKMHLSKVVTKYAHMLQTSGLWSDERETALSPQHAVVSTHTGVIIPSQTKLGGYIGFTLSVCLSVCSSVSLSAR